MELAERRVQGQGVREVTDILTGFLPPRVTMEIALLREGGLSSLAMPRESARKSDENKIVKDHHLLQ